MSENINPINMLLPIFTLKGQIRIHFIDGTTQDGAFHKQDVFNIFILVDEEPRMISRAQIRYIEGTSGQLVETDEAQPVTISDDSDVSTIQSHPVAPPAGSMWDTDVSGLQLKSNADQDEADEDTGDDATVFFEEDDLLGEGDLLGGNNPLEDDDDDVTLLFEDEEEESTVVIPGRNSDDEDDEDDTFRLTAYMECTAGPHAGQRFHLQPGTTTIGRSNDNIFALSSDKEVSRRHAQIIEQADGTFMAEDRNSLNGVIINDVRIEEPQTLQVGDEVLIGQCMLVFHKN